MKLSKFRWKISIRPFLNTTSCEICPNSTPCFISRFCTIINIKMGTKKTQRSKHLHLHTLFFFAWHDFDIWSYRNIVHYMTEHCTTTCCTPHDMAWHNTTRHVTWDIVRHVVLCHVMSSHVVSCHVNCMTWHQSKGGNLQSMYMTWHLIWRGGW